jgi:lipopolysaccharide/colanic/teichoic acid biosynthesis glycosyltransferase/glycosyltransferase involved in cell wall biosynthesis
MRTPSMIAGRRSDDVMPVIVVHITTVPETLEFLSGLIGALKVRSLDVHVISSPGKRLDDFARRAGVAAHAIAMSRRVDPLRDLVALIRLWRQLRRLRPRIVHAHTPKGGLLGMVAAWMARVPVRVYTLHGLPLQTAAGWRRRLLWWSERISCLLAHARFCVSPSLRQAVADEGICPIDRLGVLGAGSVGGVDARGRFDPLRTGAEARRGTRERLGIPAEAPVIGFVGRIARDKGILELFGAWRILRDRYPELRLLLVGPFERHDPIPVEVAEAFDRDDRVHLAGFVADTPSFYAASDILALPTHREGLGQTILEAAAMGLPVVASRVAGCIDSVRDGVTGRLVPVRDVRALSDALRGYLDDPALREAHGQAGRDRVLRHFRPEDLWDATAGAYEDLLTVRGRPALGPAPGVDGSIHPPSWRTHSVKRLLDLIAAAGGLIVLSPLMAGVALMISVVSGRPFLFRQVRPGLNGKPFVLVKFRTMREAYGPDGTPLPDADRLTPLGVFLRRTSLDELPQLWNVLKGEMSLVGPRPLLVEYLPYYNDRQRLRHEVRPGITGLAQVHGRNLLPWEVRLELDAQYVQNLSLWLDLRILARTALRVAGGSGVCLDQSRFDQVARRSGSEMRSSS